jgi:hypothetical protein
MGFCRLGYADAKKYFEGKRDNISGSSVRYARERAGSHPFDIPSSVSMHRFLGFDIKNVTHSSVAAVMDFCLYLLLLVVWKPVAVILIYAELLLVGLVSITYTVMHELYVISPVVFILAFLLSNYIGIFLLVTGALVVYKMILVGPSPAAKLNDVRDAVSCMGSLSLMARFLPTPPALEPPNKHERLSKLSIVYRIVKHFI